LTAYNLDTTLAVTATTSPDGGRTATLNTIGGVTVSVSTALDRTIGLSTTLVETVSFGGTTQAALGMTTSVPIAADISTAAYPTVESFTAILDLTAIIADYTDPNFSPDRQPISCTVTFTPRLKSGQTIWVPGMGIMLAPIKARCDADGVLRTIVGGTGVQLTANTPILDLDQLIYDVTFSAVIFNKQDQIIDGFGFIAPTQPNVVVDLSRVDKLPLPAPSWYPNN
jgi:hypothetical protein